MIDHVSGDGGGGGDHRCLVDTKEVAARRVGAGSGAGDEGGDVGEGEGGSCSQTASLGGVGLRGLGVPLC